MPLSWNAAAGIGSNGQDDYPYRRQRHGTTTKLMNQILVAGNLNAVCEALVFAQNRESTWTKLSKRSRRRGRLWQLANLGPRMVKRDFQPGFMVDLLQKDLR